jgi:hypothetical protein
MTKVKTKVLLNLTARQLICFSAAAAVGVPTYLLTRGVLGNSGAVLVMIALMLPAFFIAMYEKDGQPAEKILLHIIRMRFFFPGTRPYRTENFYQIIEREGKFAGKEPATGAAGKAPDTKRTAGQNKQKGRKGSPKKTGSKAK